MALGDYIVKGYKSKNIENEDNTGIITISDLGGILSFTLNNNSVYISYGERTWLKVKDNSNLSKTEVEIYFDVNLNPDTRDTYINFINKQTGNVETFFITQESCNYKIDVEKEEYSFIEKEEPVVIGFSVYGNTRKCVITNEHFSIIKENGKYYPFDKGLSFRLAKISDNEDENRTNYLLTIKYIGNISNLTERDGYEVVLQHSDNRKTKQTVKINISAVVANGNSNKKDVLTNIVRGLPSAISDYEYENDEKRSKEYNIIKTTSNVMLKTNKPLHIKEELKLPSLVVGKIKDNVIFIQTNTYNRNNELEHNSMISVTKIPYWCSVEDVYDAEKEIHEITVNGRTNKFGIVRQGYLQLINAERVADTKKFLITQDKENKINILEV